MRDLYRARYNALFYVMKYLE